MKNKDMMNQEIDRIFQSMATALKTGNPDGAAEAFKDAQMNVCEMIEKEFEQYQGVSDMAVLQNRGLRMLTSEENAWYQEFISAAKAGSKQAITNLTSAMPFTIIDRVIDDMAKRHPLLGALNIQNAAGATKLVVNGTQMAAKLGSWGAVASAISQELTGQISVIDITTAKYTAYFVIPKDFVKFNFTFAPMWVDQYIRIVLAESVANGLENAFINGDGKNKPAGMIMDLSSQTSGAYSAKTAVAITNWDDDYAAVIAGLAIDANGDYRNVPEVLMVVNPLDNIRKIRKAQSAITHAGIVDLISMTWPTKIVESAFMAQGHAAVGIAQNYFAAINGGQSGIVEYSDDYQFLDDARTYTVRVYGQGRPVDNVSFAYLDISGVAAPSLPVTIVSMPETTAAESTESTGAEGGGE